MVTPKIPSADSLLSRALPCTYRAHGLDFTYMATTRAHGPSPLSNRIAGQFVPPLGPGGGAGVPLVVTDFLPNVSVEDQERFTQLVAVHEYMEGLLLGVSCSHGMATKLECAVAHAEGYLERYFNLMHEHYPAKFADLLLLMGTAVCDGRCTFCFPIGFHADASAQAARWLVNDFQWPDRVRTRYGATLATAGTAIGRWAPPDAAGVSWPSAALVAAFGTTLPAGDLRDLMLRDAVEYLKAEFAQPFLACAMALADGQSPSAVGADLFERRLSWMEAGRRTEIQAQVGTSAGLATLCALARDQLTIVDYALALFDDRPEIGWHGAARALCHDLIWMSPPAEWEYGSALALLEHGEMLYQFRHHRGIQQLWAEMPAILPLLQRRRALCAPDGPSGLRW